ncbi:hypothetical protein Catovirus_1_191 [Catovirus CTV1]|uniref:Uncharacterized protein n=1 Tax=Catovirus CTV1 TaxID=1977631 RepID=A0A1V0S8W7_9VIRU|nr:hypothetical protein Catovirus_1_191 [Catovirus CTV1]
MFYSIKNTLKNYLNVNSKNQNFLSNIVVYHNKLKNIPNYKDIIIKIEN